MPEDVPMELSEEVAKDVYKDVTDGDANRMRYVTGRITKELLAKKDELGSEAFHQYIRGLLMKEID